MLHNLHRQKCGLENITFGVDLANLIQSWNHFLFVFFVSFFDVSRITFWKNRKIVKPNLLRFVEQLVKKSKYDYSKT